VLIFRNEFLCDETVVFHFCNAFQNGYLSSENVWSVGHLFDVVYVRSSLQDSRGSIECIAPHLYVKSGKLPSVWSSFSFIGTELIILHEVVMYFSRRFFNCSSCALFWVVSEVKHAHWNTNSPSHCSSLQQSTFFLIQIEHVLFRLRSVTTPPLKGCVFCFVRHIVVHSSTNICQISQSWKQCANYPLGLCNAQLLSAFRVTDLGSMDWCRN
jgi:hypothetical protein